MPREGRSFDFLNLILAVAALGLSGYGIMQSSVASREKAIDDLVKVLEEDLDDEEGHQKLSILRKKYPDNTRLKIVQAVVWTDQRLFEEAEALLEEVVKEEPNNFKAWYNKGVVHSEQSAGGAIRQQYELAIAAYKRAQDCYEKADPDDPVIVSKKKRQQLLYNLAEAYEGTNERRLAIEALVEAQTIPDEPENGMIEVAVMLGDIYTEEQRWQGAVEQYDRAKAIDKDHPGIQEKLDYAKERLVESLSE